MFPVEIDSCLLFKHFVQKLAEKTDTNKSELSGLLEEIVSKRELSKNYQNKNKVNLYLNCKSNKTKSKKYKQILVCDSIFKKYHFNGLKGKRKTIVKKNFESSLVSNLNDGQSMIKNTLDSLEKFYMPIKINLHQVDGFFDDMENIIKVWIRRHHTNNKNKIKTNFLFFLHQGKLCVEMDPSILWLNSEISYLSK